MQLSSRVPYARVAGTCGGKPVQVLVRRDGTVYGEATGGRDPLMATVAAARNCDQVASVIFHRAGWRTGTPSVHAAAHFDELQQEARVQAVRGEIAGALNEGVIRRLFEAGLAATSARARTTDDSVERQLAFIVETLDDALAELRSAIFAMASGEPDDEAPFAS